MTTSPGKPTRILFFGDSITSMGMDDGGYVHRIQSYLVKAGKASDYELIGAGVSGDKIYDLYFRIEEDVLAKNPDVVVVFEGVNDVRHKKINGTGTDLNKYEKFYAAILRKLRARRDLKLILVTPACSGEKMDNANPLDEDLNQYCDVIRRLSNEYSCQLLDFRKIVQQYQSIHNTQNMEFGLLTTDSVHLSDLGNQLLADELNTILKL